MADKNFILCGNFLHSTEENPLVVLPRYCVGVKDGTIVFIDKLENLKDRLEEDGLKTARIIKTKTNQLIIPGFIDTHIHAPQYPNAGKGLDVGLLKWLQKYTFPTESKFKDKNYAAQVYKKVIDRTVRCGTTTACYYATIHTDSTLLLCDVIEKAGQRALVGKVNANQNCPDYYVEIENESVAETKRFIDEVLNRNYESISPIVTPRFAVACSESLLRRLGDLAKTYNVPIQTHMCESLEEIDFVSKLFPDSLHYTDVYDKAGLLTDKTVLAHAVYLTEEEIKIIKEQQCAISHCPNSNLSIRSGILDLRNLLSQNVKVGLGTDVSGGYHPSIMDAIRTALHVSNVQAILNPGYRALNFKEAFRLATLGGAKALTLDHVTGNFKVGKQFDALLIDPLCKDSPIDIFEDDSFVDCFQKFIYNGDDRNIMTVFVRGKRVHSRVPDPFQTGSHRSNGFIGTNYIA